VVIVRELRTCWPVVSWLHDILIVVRDLKTCNWRTCLHTMALVPIKFVVTVGPSLCTITFSHFYRRLLFLQFRVVVRTIVGVSVFESVKSVDIAADDLRHVFWLHVLNVVIVRKASFHCGGRFERNNDLLKIRNITVHVFLEFKQAMSGLALNTLN
jgi:hypothetical protein